MCGVVGLIEKEVWDSGAREAGDFGGEGKHQCSVDERGWNGQARGMPCEAGGNRVEEFF